MEDAYQPKLALNGDVSMSVSNGGEYERNMIYRKYIKRLLDIVLSSIALILTAPVNLFLLIGTLIDVGRPVLYKQIRVGLNEKRFILVKFRNMTNDCDEDGNLLPPEQRITKFGGFVREKSLDELLNFWSILKGDMSIIGPRPLVVEYLDRYSERHKMRHSVKPGLNCPNIKRKGYSLDWDEQFENDVWYAENVSFWLDVKLSFLLVGMVFDKEKRSEQARTGGTEFIGYDAEGKAVGRKPAES